jgi:hypothetical protein
MLSNPMPTTSSRRGPAALLVTLALVAGIGATVAVDGPAPTAGHRAAVAPASGRTRRSTAPATSPSCASWQLHPDVTVGVRRPGGPETGPTCEVAGPRPATSTA